MGFFLERCGAFDSLHSIPFSGHMSELHFTATLKLAMWPESCFNQRNVSGCRNVFHFLGDFLRIVEERLHSSPPTMVLIGLLA